MRELNFPTYQFNIKREDDQLFIFDEIRKKWLVLTPEEWVRQHVVFYLVAEKGYPKGLIGVEKSIKVNQRTKRFDVVCFDSNTKPLMIVECKAPEIPIDQSTLEQALRYNSEIQAKYLLLTNGLDIVVTEIDYATKEMKYIPEIPNYEIG